MSYKNLGTKKLELPNGGTVTVYKLDNYEVFGLGDLVLPSLLEDGSSGEKSITGPAMGALANLILTKCTGILLFEQEKLKIVDKDPELTSPREISVKQLTPEDKEAIVNGVLEFSGMSGKELANAKKFRGEPELSAYSGSGEQALRDITDPVSETQSA